MTDSRIRPIRRALLSVSDKTGLVDFARGLERSGIELVATGGSHRALADARIGALDVASVTGFPEMMAGRVKTLHPKVHGAILGRRGVDDGAMADHGIRPIDLVVVNLYPFGETIARAGVTLELAIEQIDIGGPAMLRSAAKNHSDVVVVVDPADYAEVLATISRLGGTDLALRYRLAQKAFAATARYDATIARYLAGATANEFPERLDLEFEKIADLRYGENPHQRGALYGDRRDATAGSNGNVAHARQLHGKPLSYNNVADADAALECVKVFDEPACVIVKHGNPCGVALATSLQEAYTRAYGTDPTSAFGGVIAFNRSLDAGTLETILDTQFVEVVIAPEISNEAVAIAARKKNVRLLACGPLVAGGRGIEMKRVSGGLLVQTPDETSVDVAKLAVVSRRTPDGAEMADLLFAWKVAWFVKSNAIVYARDACTVGIGAGQMSRVVSAKIAALKAAEGDIHVSGAVMASDAFFPFRDGIDAAAAAGIRAVIQPGGSVRDDEVIAAADENGMAMVFTSIRHFRH